MKNFTIVLTAMLIITAGSASAAATQQWKTEKDCEANTHAKCVRQGAEWQPAPAAKTAAPAAVPAVTATTATAPATTATPATATATPPITTTVTPTVTQTQPAPAAKSSWWSGLLDGNKATATAPAAPAVPAATPAATVVTPTVTRPAATVQQAAPAPTPPRPAAEKADPLQVARGQVWPSQSACQQETKGTCESIDCSTHTGGACSGYTSIIWIYR